MVVAVLILSAFAALWGDGAFVAAHAPSWTLAGPPLISIVLAATVLRLTPAERRDAADRKRIGRVVGLSIGGEVIAMIVCGNALVWAGRPDLVTAMIAAVVGLHLLPMARWIPVPIYYATAAGMLAAAGFGLAFAPPVREVVIGGMAATVLWATVASFIRTHRRAPFAA